MRWIFVDKFLEIKKGKYAKAVKNVSLGEDHLHDHFPGHPIMPCTLIIEGMAQTGGVLAGYTRDFKNLVILAKIESARFYDVAGPGDQLIFEAELVEDREEGCWVSAKANRNGDCIAEVSIMFANIEVPNTGGGDDNYVFKKRFLSLLGVDKFLKEDKPGD